MADYNRMMADAKMAGQREATKKFFETAPSMAPVSVESRFQGSGGYEYAKLSDGSYKIVKSPKSGGGQVIKPGSMAHAEVEKEDPDAILKSTPASQIKIEPTEYPTGGTTYTGGLPATRDYQSSMIGYDRNAAKSWFKSEGGLDDTAAENTVTAMERAYAREVNKGSREVADKYKQTLQELAKLGKGGSTGVSGASYEGE